jgi:hypothetical protein
MIVLPARLLTSPIAGARHVKHPQRFRPENARPFGLLEIAGWSGELEPDPVPGWQ